MTDKEIAMHLTVAMIEKGILATPGISVSLKEKQTTIIDNFHVMLEAVSKTQPTEK